MSENTPYDNDDLPSEDGIRAMVRAEFQYLHARKKQQDCNDDAVRRQEKTA